METVIVTSKQIRQRLGTYMLDLKYKPETVICVEKPGVIMSASLARENGIDIPEKGETKSEEKADKKKK